MTASLPLLALLAIFAASAGGIWRAGITLADTTDLLAARLGLGEALGGLLVLAVATNLPEIAITATAAVGGNLDIAVGNILGGIAIQTVVLAAMDVLGSRGAPLTYRAASLGLALEAAVVCAVLAVAIMGTQLPQSLIVGRLGPASVALALLWGAGVWVVARSRSNLPWATTDSSAGVQTAPHGHSRQQKDHAARGAGRSTGSALAGFVAAAAITLVAGVAIAMSGEEIAGRIGLSGLLFGATILAAATALPELSTGLDSLRLGDYSLAISDIFGGNAFLPVLFVMASLISGTAVLPQAQPSDIYLAALGVVLTAVYLAGLVIRPKRQVLGMGIDSLVVVALYVVGLAGLAAIAAA